ncbi:uncharacterized protein LOC144427271 [Styela clava]
MLGTNALIEKQKKSFRRVNQPVGQHDNPPRRKTENHYSKDNKKQRNIHLCHRCEKTTKSQEFDSIKTFSVTTLTTHAKYPSTTGEAFFYSANSVTSSTVPASTSRAKLSLTTPEDAVIPQTTFEPSVQTTSEPSVQTTSEPAVQMIPSGFTEQDIVRYDGRIFIPLVSEQVLKASAIYKCPQLRGELANIYNQDHMNKIMTFIRDNKMGGYSWKRFHLGMTYDPINQVLRFRNKTVTLPRGFKWYRGYPVNENSAYTNMYIEIEKVSTNPNQFIYNYADLMSYVLCEI